MYADLGKALAGPVLEVAPKLLGSVLSHGVVSVRISEVEAYAGREDPGSHAYHGPTARTGTMHARAGLLYVYFVYGMHHCCNVVTGAEDEAAAVLLRAGEVVAGIDRARVRRPGAADRDLARGPANLCRALAVDRSLDGTDLSPATGGPTLRLGPCVDSDLIARGPRVGLRHAARRRWRFWLAGDPTVSAYRPAPSR